LIAFSDKQLSSAAAEIRKVDAPVAEPSAPRPSGRILPDLSEIDLRSNPVVDASSSNAETRGAQVQANDGRRADRASAGTAEDLHERKRRADGGPADSP
jgi:hypothetical protein